jgi:two-component system, NarL family, sensor histidine kinase DesK
MAALDETCAPDPVVTGRFRRGRWWRALFSGIWLVYLIQPIAYVIGDHRGPLYVAAALVIFAAFCVLYVVLMYRWDLPDAPPYAVLAALAVLAAVASVGYGGSGAAALWIYVSAAAGLVVPQPRMALRVVLGISAAYTLFSFVGRDTMTNFLIDLVPTVLVGLAMIGFRRQIELNRDLAQAREVVAKLAANEERLRLARDMHDLTGQSLSMITLKSELAAKILGQLPSSPDRDRAAEQMTEVARVSRQTLHDIREAVSGYRRPTLAVEVITARTALDAAGIEVDDDPALTTTSGTFDAEAEAALAWCLREAVTNVIRHSGARRCRIRLTARDGELSLEVSDDGHGFAPGTSQTQGAGLRGMSERLDAVGGRLALGWTAQTAQTPQAAPAGARQGFRLIASVPAAPTTQAASLPATDHADAIA